jgi:hypothetical protein
MQDPTIKYQSNPAFRTLAGALLHRIGRHLGPWPSSSTAEAVTDDSNADFPHPHYGSSH